VAGDHPFQASAVLAVERPLGAAITARGATYQLVRIVFNRLDHNKPPLKLTWPSRVEVIHLFTKIFPGRGLANATKRRFFVDRPVISPSPAQNRLTACY